MTLSNFVPRDDDNGQTLGTAQKKWSNVYTKDVSATAVNATNVTATNVTANAVAVNGGITMANGNFAIKSTNSNSNVDIGWDWATNKGSGFALRDITDGGRFDIWAKNTSTHKHLIGKPDGTLTWDNKNVVRSVDGKNADAAGNVDLGADYVVERWSNDNGTQGYTKYKSGWIDQYYIYDNGRDNRRIRTTITLPKRFASRSYTVMITAETGGNYDDICAGTGFCKVDEQQIKFGIYGLGSNDSHFRYVHILASGYAAEE